MSARITRSMAQRAASPVRRSSSSSSATTTTTTTTVSVAKVTKKQALKKPKKNVKTPAGLTSNSNSEVKAQITASRKASKSVPSTNPGPAPSGYRLSERFVTTHTAEFVEGVRRVLQIDLTLFKVVENGKFPTFEKPDSCAGAPAVAGALGVDSGVDNNIGNAVPNVDGTSGTGNIKSDSNPDSSNNIWYYASDLYKTNKTEAQPLLWQYFFQALCRGLIAQQVSGSAARAIMKRVCSLSGEGQDNETAFPSPKFFQQVSSEQLRSAGLSVRKCEYMKSVAEEFLHHPTELVELFMLGSNDEIVARLVLLRGIGEWSAQMFLLFGLKRLDVFALGDLGIARGVSRYLRDRPETMAKVVEEVVLDPKFKCKWTKNAKNAKSGNGNGNGNGKTTKRDWVPVHEQYMLHTAAMFEPYRLVIMLLLWQLASTNVDVLSAGE